MSRREITIVNKLGLHARAAARFVAVASEFSAAVRVIRADRTVNGKSIMGVMMLAAGKGTRLVIEAEGEDAEAALDALQELIESRFQEEE